MKFVIVAALAALVSFEKADAGCHRTFKGREHLHPKVFKLPALSLSQETEIAEKFPSNFDWCEKGMCTPSWNQHIPQYCGSCFAHGALSAANDRIKVMNARRGFTGPDVMLGRQSFLNCDPGHGLSGGCNGGEPAEVYEFMKQYGLPDETCLPYNATDYTKYLKSNNGTCPPEGYCIDCMYTADSPKKPVCFPVKKVVRYRATSYGRVSGEYEIMRELMRGGPVTCGIACSAAFDMNYMSGIFEDKTGFMDIDHDVEIVGFGVDKETGKKFWHIRNSWGTYWGMNGFFKIVRGVNNLGIESDCHFMEPDVSEEDLVWETKQNHGNPAFGGSIYGIRPFTDEGKASNVPDTSDVTGNRLQYIPQELDMTAELKKEVSAMSNDVKTTKLRSEEHENMEKESYHRYVSYGVVALVGVGIGVFSSGFIKKQKYQSID